MATNLKKILPAAVGALFLTLGGSAFSAPWNGNLNTTVSSGGADPAPAPNDGILSLVTGFDWHANGAAWIRGFDIPQFGAPTTDSFTLDYHGFATGIASPSPTPNLFVAAPGPATGTYEYTLSVHLEETAERIASNPFTIDISTLGGAGVSTWEIRYDTSPDANAAAGTGFTDGAIVMSGHFTSGDAIFSANGPLGAGNGNSTLVGTVTFVNALFANPNANGTEFTTGLRFPGDANLPWNRPVGVDVNRDGVIGAGELTGADTARNFVLQADGFQSLTVDVPEPATILLLGSGLLGMGFAGKRRRKV